jgi:hypothetical protein
MTVFCAAARRAKRRWKLNDSKFNFVCVHPRSSAAKFHPRSSAAKFRVSLCLSACVCAKTNLVCENQRVSAVNIFKKSVCVRVGLWLIEIDDSTWRARLTVLPRHCIYGQSKQAVQVLGIPHETALNTLRICLPHPMHYVLLGS